MRLHRTLPWYSRGIIAMGGSAAKGRGVTIASNARTFCGPSRGNAIAKQKHCVLPSFLGSNRLQMASHRSSSTKASLDGVQVTRTSPLVSHGSSSSPYHLEREDLTAFVDDLLRRTRSLMDDENNGRMTIGEGKSKSAHHVIAFSGGIDSSVATALIQRVVDDSSSSSAAAASSSSFLSSGIYGRETVTAVLGLSPAVPLDQRKLAEDVASTIGVTFEQISTTEGADEVYVANDGKACLACKTHLYDNLKSIADLYTRTAAATADSDSDHATDTILYNGTNADDLNDPTRLGLIAASNFDVRSPLAFLPKDRVRAVGKHLGLPNWDYAASPCLRSRLAVGVAATSSLLKDVGASEAFVKESLKGTWDVRKSLRVRVLSKNRAMIEVDDDLILEEIERHLVATPSWKSYFEGELGFASVSVRRFKTGSVAPSISSLGPNRIATIASPTGGTPRKLRRRP